MSKKKNISPNARDYPNTVATLTKEDFEVSFDNNSNYSTVPLSWLEFVSTFHMLEEEVDEWANLSKENRRVVDIYKQKCRATIIVGFKNDPKLMWEFYKEEYGHEMSLNEKLEEAEGFTDGEENSS